MDGDWLWIPVVLAAAAAQTLRNAAQRGLVKSVGTLPATFVRFVFGLPFAACALGALIAAGVTLPDASATFLGWLAVGAVAQLTATAFLVAAMDQRSFVVAVAFSKTEIVQIGVLSILLLAEVPTLAGIGSIALATAGVVLLSVKPGAERGAGLATWFSPAAALGLASGTCFALSVVGYRAAALALDHPQPWVEGIFALVFAQALQTALLGAWLAVRERAGLAAVARAWRVSLLAGFAGAAASMGWLTAFAMRSAVDVRVVGLVELLYSYVLSRQLFREHVSWREIAGIVLVVAGIVLVSAAP
ncbi:MAG: membrane protein [Betaproteobacteria bacterium]|nr:MAG: membrane protein [Betaproteobacteria bacterium]